MSNLSQRKIKMQCNCGEAKLVTVKKEGPNTGRKFWACAKPKGEQCDFFLWEGETPRGVQKRAVDENIHAKLDKILGDLYTIKGQLATLGATEAVKPSANDKPLPF